jgi:hypothetical protein
MMKTTHSTVRCSIILAILISTVACSEAPIEVDPAYAAELEAVRAGRLARLTAEDGWLSLTGLYWLEPGENRFGSAEDSAVVLPDPSVPDIAGLLVVGPNGEVIAFGEEGAGVEINGEPLAEATLKTDADGRPDVITAGRIQFYIINRGGRVGARVKDPEAPTRLAFEGIAHFPTDPSFKVDASFEPYDEAREVAIPTVLGQDTTMLAFGVLHFSIDGRDLTLEPYSGSAEDESLFLIFRDQTSGETSYGAGRFLSADAPGDDGTTVLDFNLSVNPPCAFTPYATCPLPPPQNILEVPIEAGEMYAGPAH